jgi:HK97 family phage prohead protease
MTMSKDRTAEKRWIRPAAGDFRTREDGGDLFIEGYFAVFNSNYEIAKGMTESIAPGAFTDELAADVRALVNHDDTLVLGRTIAKTLALSEDTHGLYGSILVNRNDQDALNAYARVDRGDVSQCSFGFRILDEAFEEREDGSVHWTIKKVKLYEVSVCTFPAYTDTNVKARKDDLDAIRERKKEAWRKSMLAKLKGGN